MAAKANQRDKLAGLCRYITRPAIAEQRLSLTNQGKVRYELKTPYRDGTAPASFPSPLPTMTMPLTSGPEFFGRLDIPSDPRRMEASAYGGTTARLSLLIQADLSAFRE